MMSFRFSALVIGVFLLSCSYTATSAVADGMPFKSKPKPILTPMDKDLEIQNKEQPVNITPPADEEAAEAEEAPHAEVPAVPESRVVEVQPNTSFFGLSVGMYDPFTHGEKAASFNFEWQPGVKVAGFLQPLFGAVVATNGSLLGYGGFGVPFNINEHVFMMPSVAVGAYKQGGGYDLNRTLAFRVGTELAYQFEDKSRIGLNMHVVSNGTSLSRHDRTEIIGLAYTMPFELLPARSSESATPAAAEQQAPQPQTSDEHP